MRMLALFPLLMLSGVASADKPGDGAYEPPPAPKYCWVCSIDLLVHDGSVGGSLLTFDSNAISAEECAADLYDQLVDEYGTSPGTGTLRLPSGRPFYLHPAWVDYYATVNMAVGIWDEWTCDDTDWSPSWPLPLPGDGEEPSDG